MENKIFESMGGKSHVRCKRHDFPLVPSHRAKNMKKNCNVQFYINEDGSRNQFEQKCERKESYHS